MTAARQRNGASTVRRGLRLQPTAIALAVLALFVLAFVAFILAPLLAVLVVAGGMWLYERVNKRRRQPGVRTVSAPRALARRVGSRRETVDDQSFGFGSGAGRGL